MHTLLFKSPWCTLFEKTKKKKKKFLVHEVKRILYNDGSYMYQDNIIYYALLIHPLILSF